MTSILIKENNILLKNIKIGSKFGDLEVIGFDEKNNKKALCKCFCGKETYYYKSVLTFGSRKSCGCLKTKGTNKRKRVGWDFAGVKFGLLTVLKILYEAPRTGYFCLCKCDCGNEKIVKSSNLKNKNVESCGCLISKSIRDKNKDYVGEVFGKLTVLERTDERTFNGSVLYRCKCDCGNEKLTQISILKTGRCISCGCSKIKPKHYIIKNQKPNRYKRIIKRGHPNSDKFGYIAEHIYVMSEFLKRPIKPGETIHHKNGIRNDNSIENLELWASYHHPGQRVSDMIEFCKSYLKEYDPEALK